MVEDCALLFEDTVMSVEAELLPDENRVLLVDEMLLLGENVTFLVEDCAPLFEGRIMSVEGEVLPDESRGLLVDETTPFAQAMGF